MLKCSALLATRSAAKWGSNRSTSRSSASIAMPTLFESLAPSVAVQGPGISLELRNVVERCVATIQSTSRSIMVPLRPSESSVLLAQQGRPDDSTPGFIRRSTRYLGDLGTNMYRNVYPDFASDQKKWIWRLIAANAATFLLWQTWGHTPNGRESMWQNFMVSIKTVRNGRLWVFATSPISSNDLVTLSLNSTALLTFGTPILAALGLAPFMGVYFGSAIVSSLAHMEYFAFPTQSQVPTPNQLWYSDHASFHASAGAASGLAGFYGAAWFKQPVNIANIFRLPSWSIVAAFTLFQVYHADNTRQAWQGNLGGLAVGAALGLIFRGRVRV